MADGPRYALRAGDCLAVMPTLAADSIDAIVTDPPYGLRFMNKRWDHGIPAAAYWGEALRVAKPGAHLLAFGGSRTFHRLVCAIEDAGWEVRDVLMWVYGSGFPKSLDVSKALDKRAGAEREEIGLNAYAAKRPNKEYDHEQQWGKTLGGSDSAILSAPATPAARQWAGWGTALKPAYEPILLARKPLAGTVAGNVLAHGTGALNIDGCRVACEANDRTDRVGGAAPKFGTNTFATDRYSVNVKGSNSPASPDGRFPANLIHDGSPEVLALFPDTGPAKTGVRDPNGTMGYNGGAFGLPGIVSGHDDAGGSAARFFYTAKASKQDRDEGCDGLDRQANDFHRASSGLNQDRPGREGRTPNTAGTRNYHPTVKPTALMRYLCRLITPPDGLILDPFMGSGSTGKAALREGFRFTGIEIDPDYLAIARARISAATP